MTDPAPSPETDQTDVDDPDDALPVLDAVLIVMPDGETLGIDLGGITPAQAGALRQQSHDAWRVVSLLDACAKGIGPEELAGLVFLARRQAGAEITYDAVCASLQRPGDAVVNFTTLDQIQDNFDPEA